MPRQNQKDSATMPETSRRCANAVQRRQALRLMGAAFANGVDETARHRQWCMLRVIEIIILSYARSLMLAPEKVLEEHRT